MTIMRYIAKNKRFVIGGLFAFALLLVPGILRAQTISITPVTVNNTAPDMTRWKLFMGANYSGIYSNIQFRVTVSTGFTNPIELDAISAPAGVSATFTPNLFTNTQTITMMVA